MSQRVDRAVELPGDFFLLLNPGVESEDFAAHAFVLPDERQIPHGHGEQPGDEQEEDDHAGQPIPDNTEVDVHRCDLIRFGLTSKSEMIALFLCPALCWPAISLARMIKTFLLIFNPAEAWDRIVRARRSLIFIFVIYLLPLLLATSLAAGYGLIHWGKLQGTMGFPKRFSLNEAMAFEAAYVTLSLLIVFIGAQVVKSLGETFHSRNTYLQTFTLLAYGLSPLFLLHILDAFRPISPWVSWFIGIMLSWGVLYHGVPKVMEPDPSHGFGLYLVTSIVLCLATGLTRLVTAWYLQGKLGEMGPISHLNL